MLNYDQLVVNQSNRDSHNLCFVDGSSCYANTDAQKHAKWLSTRVIKHTSPQASIMNIYIYNKTSSDVSSYYSTSSIFLRDEPHPFTILHHQPQKEAGSSSKHPFSGINSLLVSGMVCLHPSIVDVLDVLLPRRKSLDPPGGCGSVYAFPPEVPKHYCFKWSKTESIVWISRALLNFINNSKGH